MRNKEVQGSAGVARTTRQARPEGRHHDGGVTKAPRLYIQERRPWTLDN